MCQITIKKDLSLPLSEALDKLSWRAEGERGSIDVAFTIAGAPLEGVKDIINQNPFLNNQSKNDDNSNEPDIRIMSIDPSMYPELNDKFNLKLRMSTFKGIYKGHEVSRGAYIYELNRRIPLRIDCIRKWGCGNVQKPKVFAKECGKLEEFSKSLW